MANVPPEGTEFVIEDFKDNLKSPEYITFAGVLVASLGIGMFYGCFGSKIKSNEEFLMAGRSMSILPVTLSLVCTFVSGAALLGNPVETYYYGQVFTLLAVAFIPMTLVLMYWYVPVFFELKLTSAYEYFEWRFSRRVRCMCSIFAMIHLIFYQPITVLGPALAIDQVAGLKYYITSGAIFLVCIAYSSLGGLKAVLWTDALQAGVMFTAVGSICICGVIEVGGFSYVWEKSAETDRTELFIFDPDPRARHTFWTGIVGGFFLYLPLFGATQAQIQRYNSVPSLRHAKFCLLFNMVGMMTVIVLLSFLGMLCYAKYWDCNPMDSKAVTNSDQLIPLFVMDALREYPVIPGLLLAGLTSGSLSSVSSALNSLSCLVTEDFVKHYRPHWDDVKLGYVSKIVSTVSGFLAFGMLFVVKVVNETVNLAPLSTLIHGALLGPILAAFTLGMFVPWANTLGVFSGMIVSILLTSFVAIGNIIIGRQNKVPDQRLELSTAGCKLRNVSTTAEVVYSYAGDFIAEPYYRAESGWKERHEDDSFFVKMWSTSYIWQPGIGCVTTLIFGALFSYIVIKVNGQSIKRVHKNLLSKPWLRFWEKVVGPEGMIEWVDYSEDDTFRKKVPELEDVSLEDKPGLDLMSSGDILALNEYSYGAIPRANVPTAKIIAHSTDRSLSTQRF